MTIEPFPDDPLGKAKEAAFSGPPVVHISAEQTNIQWDSPFLYLMCLNEEDGLEFKVLQQTDGSEGELRVFWQGSDVTDKVDTFETLISDHELQDVFKLRAVALLQDRIRQQLARLHESDDIAQSLGMISTISPHCQNIALTLRKEEMAILECGFEAVNRDVSP